MQLRLVNTEFHCRLVYNSKRITTCSNCYIPYALLSKMKFQICIILIDQQWRGGGRLYAGICSASSFMEHGRLRRTSTYLRTTPDATTNFCRARSSRSSLYAGSSRDLAAAVTAAWFRGQGGARSASRVTLNRAPASPPLRSRRGTDVARNNAVQTMWNSGAFVRSFVGWLAGCRQSIAAQSVASAT